MRQLLHLLAPALFPSWRFFQAIEPSPRLEVRDAEGRWQAHEPLPRRLGFWRGALRLVWNPGWNARLYLVSLSERVATGEAGFPVAEIEARLGQAAANGWRLVFVHRQGAKLRAEVILTRLPPGAEV